MRLVLDTNVVVAALLWHGAPRQLLDRSIDDETLELYSSPTLVDELRNTLSYPKLAKRIARCETSIETLVRHYELLVTLVSPTQTPRVVPTDPDDDAVVACAAAAEAELIVSGDSDLLGLKECQGIPIVTVVEALRRIEAP